MTRSDSIGIGRPPLGWGPSLRETDYRWACFLAWSGQLREKRVAVYGSGANARRILQASDLGFSVTAVLDDHAAGKEMCGYVIEAAMDESLREVDCIVVAAEFKSAIAVARRLVRSCPSLGVELYDMYGNDLAAIMGELEKIVAYTVDEQLKAIEQSDMLCMNIDLLMSDRPAKPIAECMADGSGLDRCIASIAEYAIASGKRVVFYAPNTMISREDAEALLMQHGLLDACSLLLASECGLWAENGLFRRMYCDAGSGKALHIGSDQFVDGFIPLCHGMSSILVGLVTMPAYLWNVQEATRLSNDGAWYHAPLSASSDSPEERLRRSIAASLLAVCEREGERICGIVSVVAPLVIGYLTWLIDMLAKEPGRFDKVLFASRDAYVVSKAYDIARGHLGGEALPEPLYFYTSRKASLAASQQDRSSSKTRRNALKNLSNSGLELGKRYAFVEFVGAGTCQRQLERYVPFALTGFYFGSRVGDLLPRYVDCSLYFSEQDTCLLNRYLRFEPYLSSAEPSLVGFNAEGQPLFAQEHRTDEELARLQAVHEGVLHCVRAYFTQWYREGDVVGHGYVDRIAAELDSHDDDLMSLYDDLNGTKLTKRIGDAPIPDSEPASAHDGGPAYSALLDLLTAFDTVCQEFGLRYIATHGTLLGAVRNGGFVPGDDDLDVAMPREDYDRLLALADQGVFPEPLFLQAPENDPACFYGGYAKLRDASVPRCASDGKDRDSDQSIWMDIMPLDDCPAKDEALSFKRNIVRVWQRALYAKTYGIHRLWGVDPYKMIVCYALGDKMSHKSLCRHLRNACTSCKPSGYLTIFAGNYSNERGLFRFSISDVENAPRVAFEGTTIPIPAHAREWLASYYGPDWETEAE